LPTPAAADELTVAHTIVRILEQEGVERVFGVPGGPLTGFFEALKERNTIEFVLAKHEGAAAYMACSHARVSGRLSVCIGTSGPGATNALTGIASARADSLPVLMLSGQVGTNVFGKGAIQESSVFGTNLVDIFRPVTKLSTILPNAERTPDLLRAAIRTAMSGRRGPVHLSVPADILRKKVPYLGVTPAQYRSIGKTFDKDAALIAARLLENATNPCILAGHGIESARAHDELLKLAMQLQAPVMTSPKGKGSFPENHPLSLGVLGFGGHDAAENWLRSGEIDVLLIVGSSLNEFVTNAWTLPVRAKTALIQLDIDPEAIGRNYPVDLAVVGDAAAALKEIHGAIYAEHQATDSGIRAARSRYSLPDTLKTDSVPLKPQRVVSELRAAMPDDAMLFVDNGTSIIWAGHYFEARGPNTYFVDLGLASMGSAVAGVVGGALAAREKRSVALVGDAAFAMHGFEVHTAVEQRLPIVWIVLNNSGHGMVHQGDTLMHGAPLGVSDYRVPINAAAFAVAVGARGASVRTPDELTEALNAALNADVPTVIDVLIDPNEIAPTLIRRVQSLDRFFAAGDNHKSRGA
jgi:acetolactate synthase-1/2/3 large subunit